MDVKRIFSALIAASAALLMPVSVGQPAAWAHDVVIRSVPADSSTVEQAPTRIELEFSGIPKDTFNTVALSNQDTGEVLFTADPKLDDQIIRVDVPANVDVKPGNYKVGFQITSSDGHATRGMTTFRVAGDNPEASAGDEEMVASSSEAPYTNQQFLNRLIGGFVAFVVVVVGIVLVLSRRKK